MFLLWGLSWGPVNKENKDNVVDFLETLEEDDDVQNVYSNVNLGGI
jgi:transcriptional/translational regulatory protein YebC/TACO1